MGAFDYGGVYQIDPTLRNERPGFGGVLRMAPQTEGEMQSENGGGTDARVALHALGALLGGLAIAGTTHYLRQQASRNGEGTTTPETADPNFRALTRRPSAVVGGQPTSTGSAEDGASATMPNTVPGDAYNAPAFGMPPLAEPVLNAISVLAHPMGSYSDWQKRKKKLEKVMPGYAAQIEARARERGNFSPDDPGDECTQQYDRDMNDCNARFDDYHDWGDFAGCKARAAARLADCRTPKGYKPPKWRPGTDDNPGDEEMGNPTPPEWRRSPYAK